MYSEATAGPTPTASARTSSWEGTRPGSSSAGSRPQSQTTRRAQRHAGASRRRLFYTKLNDGHERPVLFRRSATAESSAAPWSCARCAARSPKPPTGAELASRTELHVEIDADHNLALLTSACPGQTSRRRSPPSATTSSTARDLMPSTSTFRWRRPRRRWSPTTWSGWASPTRRNLPNSRTDGDVLRMQSLHRVRVGARDVKVASSTAASCSTTCSPTCPPRRVEPELGASLSGEPHGRRGGSAHLALDTLQGVVHCLGVALEALGDDLVGVAIEVEGEDTALQIGADPETPDRPGPGCPSSSACDTWSTGSGAWSARAGSIQRRVRIARRGPRLAKRDVLVEGEKPYLVASPSSPR